jgi:precorrin-2 methylase
MVESSSDDILKDADSVDVAFLVVGDPFGYASPSLYHTLSNDIQEQRHTPISSSVRANSPSPHAPSPTPAS